MGWDWETDQASGVEKPAKIKKWGEPWVWEPIKTDGSGRLYGGKRLGQLLREEVYDCGFCRGTGERPPGFKCPVCKNAGTVAIQPPAVVCAFCKGRGEEKPRSTITCTACKGRGVISVQEPIERCSSCSGRGRPIGSGLYCMGCKGSGVVTVMTESDDDEGEPRAVVHRPSGSEMDALEAIRELGRAGRHRVGGRLHVSAAYANYILKALLKKGLLKMAERDIFVLSPMAEQLFEERAARQEESEETTAARESIDGQEPEEIPEQPEQEAPEEPQETQGDDAAPKGQEGLLDGWR